MPNAETIRLVLASSSPRRRQLLARLGVLFEVAAADVDETAQAGESPADLALRLSMAKAQAISSLNKDVLIMAADTLVALDEEILGKPEDEHAAYNMLVRLRGRAHVVHTGLALVDRARGRCMQRLVKSTVFMRHYTDDEIRRYIASGDPMDKAGAYAIQYGDFAPVARVEGCATNVMGLPLCHLYCLLRAWDVAMPVEPHTSCARPEEDDCPWCTGILAGLRVTRTPSL